MLHQQPWFELSHDRPGGAARVCFVLPPTECYSGSTGGAISTVTRQLTRSLIELGHPVDVITPDCDGTHYADGDVHVLEYGTPTGCGGAIRKSIAHKGLVLEARLRKWSWPDYGSYLRKVLRQLDQLVTPDLVIVANDPELAHRLHGEGIGRRQALWLHNQMEGKEARRLHDLAAEVSLVAVSQSVATWTSKTYGIPAEAISVVHNGVDLEEFHPRDGFLRPTSPVRVICHGRIDPNKGHDIAARAVAVLRGKGLPVTFTMVGAVQTFGIPEAHARAFAEELAAATAEAGGTSTGRIPADQVAAVLREHDIACVLSKSEEPFPLSLLESMASGCAVITTTRGGIKEAAGDAGLVVGVDDVDGVASAIESLITDPMLLAERKASARARAESFTWEKSARTLESVIEAAGRRR
jgi:glycosyltransferase involved in cell wall biosynthesis